MRRCLAFVVSAAALAASPLPPAVAAEGDAGGWAGTRWSGYSDCSRNWISLAPGGTLSVSNGATGTWRGGGSSLYADVGGYKLLLERKGDFVIADEGTERAGSSWQQCDPTAARPYLPRSWIEGSRWSGFSDCRVQLTFERGGNLRISNGGSGTWSLSQSRLTVRTGGPSPLLLTRTGKQLVADGGGSFVRC